MPKREGYLLVDHRASPGVPEGFYRKQGYAMPEVPEGRMLEAAVLVCLHCQQHLIVNPLRSRERGHCFKCSGFVCDICEAAMRAPDYVHRPFAKIVDDFVDGPKAPSFSGNATLLRGD